MKKEKIAKHPVKKMGFKKRDHMEQQNSQDNLSDRVLMKTE
jgi:hypothetical protein